MSADGSRRTPEFQWGYGLVTGRHRLWVRHEHIGFDRIKGTMAPNVPKCINISSGMVMVMLQVAHVDGLTRETGPVQRDGASWTLAATPVLSAERSSGSEPRRCIGYVASIPRAR